MYPNYLFAFAIKLFYQKYGKHANIITWQRNGNTIYANHRKESGKKPGYTMNTINFAKGMGVGLVVGSAVTIAVATSTVNQKKSGRKSNVVGKTLKTMGDIVESIGDSIGM